LQARYSTHAFFQDQHGIEEVVAIDTEKLLGGFPQDSSAMFWHRGFDPGNADSSTAGYAKTVDFGD
jgi:hypothetical protein